MRQDIESTWAQSIQTLATSHSVCSMRKANRDDYLPAHMSLFSVSFCVSGCAPLIGSLYHSKQN